VTNDVLGRSVTVGTPHRAFRLTHVMVLVACFALFLACFRSVQVAWAASSSVVAGMASPLLIVLTRLSTVIRATLPFLAVATLSIFAFRLLPPRPTLARLARQPGALACGVASLFLIAPVGGSLTWVLFRSLSAGPGSLWTNASEVYDVMSDWGYLIGLAVAVAWVVLGAVQGWRAEPSAFDRAGRFLGWSWVVLAPVEMAVRFMILLGSLS
jgi:hypothetical protein